MGLYTRYSDAKADTSPMLLASHTRKSKLLGNLRPSVICESSLSALVGRIFHGTLDLESQVAQKKRPPCPKEGHN